jgi:transposase InsO family protein
MKEAGIKASTTGLYTWRPGIQALYSSAGNHLAESEAALASGEQWAGDFTHIRTGAGWLYLAIVIDLYCRKVVGWSFSRARNTDLTKSALQMAVANQVIKPGCLFHSDQGVEYAAYEYRDELASAGLTRSMIRKATPLDNAAVESFFHTLKAELVHQHTFCDQIEATAHIMAYIEFYNRERIHTSLNFQSPMEYERLCA